MSQARDFADSFSAVSIGRRNMIINGAMEVAQRGTSVTSQTSADPRYHTVDRFLTETSGGTYDAEQSTTTPDGFSNSLKVTIDGAFTPTSSQHIIPFEYRIEGQDLQHLTYGTSDAKSVTLSFWIRSSKTGTYVVEFSNFNSAQTRKYSKQYTINSADTWEYKTLTWEGDTVRSFDNNNDVEGVFYWWMTAGTDFTSGTIPSGWENSTTANRAVGVPTSLADNDEFYLTGVQLEVGNSASPFEHRSYGEELALCRRYFYSTDDSGSLTNYITGDVINSTSAAMGGFVFPTQMRSVPSVSFLGTNVTKFYSTATGTDNTISISGNRCSKDVGAFLVTGFTGATAGQAATLYDGGSGSGIAFDSEL